MTPQEFLNEFGTLAESAEAVPKLRAFVLQLAVHGKLDSHDGNDEPAEELLRQIMAVGESLRLEKGIRQTKPFPIIEPQDELYSLPSNWVWTRLDHLCYQITDGAHHTPTYTTSGIPFLSVKDVSSGDLDFSNTRFISEEQHAELTRRCNPEFEDLLLTKIGTTGIAKVIDVEREFSIFVSLALLKFPPSLLFPNYLELMVNSPLVKEQSAEFTQGVGNKNLVLKHIRNFAVPLPPLAEQHRIVSKVDALMGLCDRLEAVQSERHGVRVRLNRSSLHRLTSVSGVGARQRGSELTATWQRVCDHFEVLYDTPETLPDLRQTILQLAVQGKLASQNPNDETAEKLLSHVEEARHLQEQQGSIRKRKPVPELTNDDLAYDVPLGWSWVQFEKIADLAGGVAKGRKLNGKETVAFPYLRVANVQMGYLDLSVMKEIEIPLDELEKYRLERNDLLLTEGGDWDKLGRTAIWEGQVETCLHQNHVFRGRLYLPKSIRPRWVRLVMNSGVGRDYFARASKQTTNLASINMTQLRSCPIPIPPTAEQDAILTKVRDLLSHVEQLDQALTRRESTRTKLLVAASHSILNGAES